MLGVTICTKCEGEKEDNSKSQCPSCILEAKRTKEGLVTAIYSGQKSHSKTRGHRPPEYTKQELKDWLFSQTLFHELYDEWVQSGHKSRLKPSVDRECDEVHYCMRNITLMTWGENNIKSHKEHSRNNGMVMAITIEVFRHGKSVGQFDSVKQANREIKGISKNTLYNCLRDGTKTKGYTVLALE